MAKETSAPVETTEAEVEVNRGFVSTTHVHVVDTGGEGRPVVLIHGWPLSSASWAGQIPALTDAGYRVVAYDRRGFGQSDKPAGGYDYDTLTEDLNGLLNERHLKDVTLVGFSMGGGEVARYVSDYGDARIRSVVFASAVPPYLLRTNNNPEGPLTQEKAAEMTEGLTADRSAFFDQFTKDFFSSNGVLKVSEQQRREAIALCHQSGEKAALKCMKSFGTEDFRHDLTRIKVPALVIHGDADATVPLYGSGVRTHQIIAHSELVILNDAPHGCNVSHPDEFNKALVRFVGSTDLHFSN